MMDLSQFMSDPKYQALLGLSAGLLKAAGPSDVPVSTGQALGQGLLGMQSGYMQAIQNGLLMEKMADAKKAKEDKAKLREAFGTAAIPGQMVPQEDELTRQMLPPMEQGGTPGTGLLGGGSLEDALAAMAKYGDTSAAMGGLVDIKQSQIAANAAKSSGQYNQQQITTPDGKVWWADPRDCNRPTSPVMGPDGKQMVERTPPGAQPSIGRNILLPILQKLQKDGYNSLTPNEKRIYQDYRTPNTMQQLVGGALGPELDAAREDYPTAPADPSQRKVNNIYKSPTGSLGRWTGTGWQPL